MPGLYAVDICTEDSCKGNGREKIRDGGLMVQAQSAYFQRA